MFVLVLLVLLAPAVVLVVLASGFSEAVFAAAEVGVAVSLMVFPGALSVADAFSDVEVVFGAVLLATSLTVEVVLVALLV